MSYAIHMIYYIYNRGCDMHVLMSYAIHNGQSNDHDHDYDHHKMVNPFSRKP